jgi:hypothetical protein
MKTETKMWVGLILLLMAPPSLWAQYASSPFMQRILDLKQGQLPPVGFVLSLQKHDHWKFARAVCMHGGTYSSICQKKSMPTLGWSLCIVGGRPQAECDLPKNASVGFGLCMAAGRDVTDCNYVQNATVGYGLCMASGRSFHECSAPSQPSLPFAYCMARSDNVSHCLDLN